MDRSADLDWTCIFCHHGDHSSDRGLDQKDKEVYRSYHYVEDPRGRGHMEIIVGPISERAARSARNHQQPQTQRPTQRHQEGRIVHIETVYPGRTLDPDGDGLYTPAYMHAACLQLARVRLSYFNARFVDRFSRYTMTSLPRFVIDSVAKTPRARPTPPFPTSRLKETELATLLQRAAKLPPEIQAHICAFLGRGLVTSLLTAHKTLEWAESRMQAIDTFTYNGRGEIKLTRYSTAPFSFLGAKTVSILGETCLVDIGTDPSGDFNCLIPIDDKWADGELLGIDYMLGTYGVCAMRLKYRDRSVSQWLGKEFGWITFSPLKNLRGLTWAEDGIKITGMRPSSSPSTGQVSSDPDVARLFWERETPLPPTAILRVIDMSIQNPMVIRFHPRDRFVRYLPFTSGDGSMHSLTVFSNVNGVSCIVTDGVKRRQLGTPTWHDVAVTRYLHADEVVDSIFIVNRHSAQIEDAQGPFLLVKTSRGKFHYFGAFLMPFMPYTQAHLSAFGHENTHRTTGIFYDPVSTVLGGMETIGVVLEPRDNVKQPAPAEPVVKIPIETRPERHAFLDTNLWTAFVSHASFAGVKVLKAQTTVVEKRLTIPRDMPRWCGLRAEFDDGRLPVILGQWDPLHEERTRTVHTVETDGPLKSLTFVPAHFEPFPPWIQNVLVNARQLPEPCFVWDDLSTPVGWFFAYGSDHVEAYVGEVWDVNVTGNAVRCETVS